MATKQRESLVLATCICCDKQFWMNEAYQACVQAGTVEATCQECDDPEVIEDDNAAELLEKEQEEPNPEDRG